MLTTFEGFDSEIGVTTPYIWRQHFNLQPTALYNRGRGSLGVAHVPVQQSHHILDGVVRLEVRCPVGDQSVAHAVRFVEGVARKRFDQREDLFGKFLGVALFDRPF